MVKTMDQRSRAAVNPVIHRSESTADVNGSDPNFGVAEYLRAIIRRDAELTQSSRETYFHSIRNHIDGTALGTADIRTVTPDMLRDYWAEAQANKGVGVRRNVHLILSKGFTHALLDGEISQNPLKRARIKTPTKNRREEVVPLTVEEVESIAASALHENVRISILIMGYLGLRAGEVCGLRVQDIDFEPRRLSVRKQVVYTPGVGKHWAPLKTTASKRTIAIPQSIALELKSFIEVERPAKDGRIIHGPNGEMWAHQTMNHGVQHAAKVARIEGVFSHRFRHTAVALLIDDGASPKAIQAFCGHAKISVTLDTYGHLFDYGGLALATSMEARREKYRNGRTPTSLEQRPPD